MHGYSLGRLIAMSLRSFLPEMIKQYVLKLLNRPSIIPDWINKYALETQISDIGMSDKNIEGVSLDQLLKFSVPKQLKWCDRDRWRTLSSLVFLFWIIG